MIQPLTIDQLEEIVDELRRQVQEQEERIREHEGRLNDMYLWLAAIGEDMIERTADAPMEALEGVA
jgi:TolA-binding protein